MLVRLLEGYPGFEKLLDGSARSSKLPGLIYYSLMLNW